MQYIIVCKAMNLFCCRKSTAIKSLFFTSIAKYRNTLSAGRGHQSLVVARDDG